MTAVSQPARNNRRWYLDLRPRTARILAHIGIDGAWAYFLLKFSFRDDASPLLLKVGGVVLISALLCSAVLFFSRYSFIANAPSQEIDERELAERYRAHFYAFQYVVVGLILGWLGAEFAGKRWDYTPSLTVIGNYLTVMISTSLIMPAALLAYWDREP